jgi:hypothetical protein
MTEKNSCSFCSSTDFSREAKYKTSSLPDGSTFKYLSDRTICENCGVVASEDRSNYNLAFEAAKKSSLESICTSLSVEGFKIAFVERALGLPQRTIGRWKSQGCSASAMALMNMVRTFPFLVHVADHNYSKEYAHNSLVKYANYLCAGSPTTFNYVNSSISAKTESVKSEFVISNLQNYALAA